MENALNLVLGKAYHDQDRFRYKSFVAGRRGEFLALIARTLRLRDILQSWSRVARQRGKKRDRVKLEYLRHNARLVGARSFTFVTTWNNRWVLLRVFRAWEESLSTESAPAPEIRQLRLQPSVAPLSGNLNRMRSGSLYVTGQRNLASDGRMQQGLAVGGNSNSGLIYPMPQAKLFTPEDRRMTPQAKLSTPEDMRMTSMPQVKLFTPEDMRMTPMPQVKLFTPEDMNMTTPPRITLNPQARFAPQVFKQGHIYSPN